jgi:hypothetical protein
MGIDSFFSSLFRKQFSVLSFHAANMSSAKTPLSSNNLSTPNVGVVKQKNCFVNGTGGFVGGAVLGMSLAQLNVSKTRKNSKHILMRRIPG